MEPYLGDVCCDGHASQQEQAQQSTVAHNSCPSGQRHEVVPVVDVGQDGVGDAGLVPSKQRLQQPLKQHFKLLQQCKGSGFEARCKM